MLPSINGMTESAMTVTNEFPADGSGSQEEFRPATEFFNDPNAFEYLEGRGAHMKPSALARQSLYQMFDPMLGTPSPPAQRTAAAAPTIIKEQPESSNPNDETFALMGTPPLSARPAPMSTETPPGLSRCILDQTNMLDASINPAGGLPQQLNTLVLIPQAQNGPNEIVQILQYSEQDAENMISRNNLEWTNKMFVQRGEWEKKTKVLEREMHELHNTHQRKLQENVDMKGVVSEYETTISQLIAEKEHNKCEATENNSELVAERDQVLEDMQNVEKAFSDLHRRYEKAKGVVEALRKNEDTLKCMVEEYQAKLKKQEHRYQELKNKAEEKLESAVMEIETIKRNNASELVALRAGLKRADMKVANLDRICEQKTKENQELTNICDELIAKVTR
ncbi:PREDICTED: transforming acidic coiled-coil-containing protein 3-like isoform X2 [Priapulus caudatus]|uniref:Transforming acidic coiled-coil-containing protein 3-like isoform X1 n=1 Tax=Priapulus caudatus TaxID=37621 RepID=A0ABM1FAE8_PRICU|nr:PREDICTED: transforming acidic coiled-coil-containing protein 3-like isoform X1 [Priapulus caudatus]XP_014681420.1 PREDICTED: transforming acidic coiled-coil-containing protein 3-like isoform X2 [Priapulus caudatus]